MRCIAVIHALFHSFLLVKSLFLMRDGSQYAGLGLVLVLAVVCITQTVQLHTTGKQIRV